MQAMSKLLAIVSAITLNVITFSAVMGCKPQTTSNTQGLQKTYSSASDLGAPISIKLSPEVLKSFFQIDDGVPEAEGTYNGFTVQMRRISLVEQEVNNSLEMRADICKKYDSGILTGLQKTIVKTLIEAAYESQKIPTSQRGDCIQASTLFDQIKDLTIFNYLGINVNDFPFIKDVLQSITKISRVTLINVFHKESPFQGFTFPSLSSPLVKNYVAPVAQNFVNNFIKNNNLQPTLNAIASNPVFLIAATTAKAVIFGTIVDQNLSPDMHLYAGFCKRSLVTNALNCGDLKVEMTF